MELKDGIKTFYAASQREWRNWLERNHQLECSVWLIIYKKDSTTPSVYYPEAVDEALCFGWIDSKPNKRDDDSYFQFFARRNPKSNWSKINKEKVARLIQEGRMHTSGLEIIDLAKRNGKWTALEKVDNLVLPEDLERVFTVNTQAFEHWQRFPPSSKRGILEWIYNAKRPETRRKRIEMTVALAEKNIRANHYPQ